MPQPPQFCGFEVVSTHSVPQGIWPEPQLLVPPAPADPVVPPVPGVPPVTGVVQATAKSARPSPNVDKEDRHALVFTCLEIPPGAESDLLRGKNVHDRFANLDARAGCTACRHASSHP